MSCSVLKLDISIAGVFLRLFFTCFGLEFAEVDADVLWVLKEDMQGLLLAWQVGVDVGPCMFGELVPVHPA